MSYTKQGVNYGIGSLPIDKIEADLTFLRQHFNYIRITYPAFNAGDATIAYWKDIALRARAKGFASVMVGLYCPKTAAKDWYKFLQAFIDMAPWAQQNSIVLGVNEEAYHNDEAVISDDQVFRDLHNAARLAKLKAPNSKLAISLAGDGELEKFIAFSGPGAAGRGAFNLICLNQYDTLATFKANIDKIAATYGSDIRITEESTGRGFDPNYGDEASWTADVKARADYIQASPIPIFYIYTYADNPETCVGGANKWNFRTGQNPETQHEAFALFERPA